MRVPEVRERLEVLATVYGLPELAILAWHLKRRAALRPKARATSRRLTLAEQGTIRRRYLRGGVSMMSLAVEYGTNSGRISEAVQGKRT